MKGQFAGEFAGVTGEVVVCAGDGNDQVYISRHIYHDTLIEGGTGRDWGGTAHVISARWPT